MSHRTLLRAANPSLLVGCAGRDAGRRPASERLTGAGDGEIRAKVETDEVGERLDRACKSTERNRQREHAPSRSSRHRSAVLWIQVARSIGARPSARRYTQRGIVIVPFTIPLALLALRLFVPSGF
jgi:hypothetical protein